MSTSFPFFKASQNLNLPYDVVLRIAASFDNYTDQELQSIRYHDDDATFRCIVFLVMEERRRRREVERGG